MTRLILGLASALALTLVPAAATEAERVLAFSADLTVDASGTMTVVESIGVHSEAREIVHGIIRTIPTDYHDATGKPVALKVSDVVVARDGYADGAEIGTTENGIEIRIGKADVTLGDGNHVYTITYKVTGAVADLPTGYQLAWNVTGHNWQLPIETSAARIYLPAGAKSSKLSVTTGALGSNTGQATIVESAPGQIVAGMPKQLNPGEGLTVFVDWPKAP